MLKQKGFEYVFHKYVYRYRNIGNNKSLYRDKKLVSEVNQLIKLISLVCRLFPVEAECIHRSLLVYKYTRKLHALDSQMIIGVKKFPFKAHAWVEINGKNINEPEFFTRDLHIILTSKEVFQK